MYKSTPALFASVILALAPCAFAANSVGNQPDCATPVAEPVKGLREIAALRAGLAGPVVRISKEQMSCEAVNEAVAGLPAIGGTIELPEGDYTCSSPIKIDRNNVKLVGAGSKKTFLHTSGSNPVPVVVIGSTNNTRLAGPYKLPYPDHQTVGVLVQGLDIDGGYRPAPGKQNLLECWNPKTGVSQVCGADAGSMIRNNGITVRGGEDIQIEDVASHNNYSGGITLEKENLRVRLTNVDLHSNFFDGVACYETHESVFDRVTVRNNGYSGVSVDDKCSGNVFAHGSVHDNGDNGIFSVNVHNTYDDMDVRNNRNHEVYIENFRTNDGTSTVGSCDGNQITNSRFKSPANHEAPALFFGYECRNVLISNTEDFNTGLKCLSVLKTPTREAEIEMKNLTCTNGKDSLNWNGVMH